MNLLKIFLVTGFLALASAAGAAEPWAKETDTLLGVTVGKPVPKLPLCLDLDAEENKTKCLSGLGSNTIENGPDLGFPYGLVFEQKNGVVANVMVAARASEYDRMRKLAVMRFGKPGAVSGQTLAWLGKRNALTVGPVKGGVVMTLFDTRALNQDAKTREMVDREAASKF